MIMNFIMLSIVAREPGNLSLLDRLGGPINTSNGDRPKSTRRDNRVNLMVIVERQRPAVRDAAVRAARRAALRATS
jgi:hypothetical protein